MIEILTSALVIAASMAAVRLARSVAIKKVLLDLPNERSSHKVPVPRLGGAAFIPVVLLYVLFVWFGAALPNPVQAAFFSGAILLFGVSLIDDFVSLSTRLRFVIQFLAAGGLVWAATTANPLPYPTGIALVLGAAATVAIVGLLNIYNFMDGIDGIAGIQALVGGVAWFAIARIAGAPAVALLAIAVAAGALGFLTLNWPPAKIFMGDAGSTVLGYTFAAIPLLVWVETKSSFSIGALALSGGLIVWPFLADGVFTIFRRLSKRENIFKAHRSHLYQRLVIAGRSHRSVTLVYGGLAIVGGILAWCVVSGVNYAGWGAVIVVAALFVALWRWTVVCEARGPGGEAVGR